MPRLSDPLDLDRKCPGSVQAGGYLVAVMVTAAAVLLRWLLDSLLRADLPLITLYSAVAGVVWYGGYRPALLTTALGYLASNYLFIEPRGALAFRRAGDLVGLLLYLISCLIIIGFGSGMKAAQRRYQAALLEALGKQKQLEDEITERKHTEEALRQSEERFRRYFELGLIGMAITSPTQGCLEVNDQICEILGYERSELLHMTWTELTHPDDLAADVAHFNRVMAGEIDGYVMDKRWIRKNGQVIHSIISVQCLRCADGSVDYFVALLQDITERKHLEAQLRQSQKMEAIGRLAGGIAHDFNNILSAILGYTELALYKVSQDSKVRCYLQEVLTAEKRAKELVQHILTFSRKSDRKCKPLHLHQVVKEALKLLRASLPTTITIFQDIHEDRGPILADPTEMHQVLMNLCANAEYAMRQTGGILAVHLDAVEVDAAFTVRHPALRPGPHVRLTVQDTGSGIAPELLEQIFEPFFTTKDVGQGSGMGLAVVHGIVSSYNGAMTVQSTLGKGTTFAMYLPQIAATADGETPPEESITHGEGRVLFVDDEEALAHVGQVILGCLGYDVVVRTSGVEALEMFRATPQRFDAVITDQTMPRMTGEQLARELRRIRLDIPIILCTGFSHVMDTEKAQALGIDRFLMKPVGMQELGTALQQVLAPRSKQGAASG